MTIFDRLYEENERHRRYTRDTNIFLDEVVQISRRVLGTERWETSTKFPMETPIKELTTRVFKQCAKLLARTRASRVHFSRLSKLALDRAIDDRKEQAYFYKVLSTQNAKQLRIYRAHVYSIEVLQYMRHTVRHLFEPSSAGSVVSRSTPADRLDYRVLLGLADAKSTNDPEEPKDNGQDEESSPFWPIVQAIMDKCLDIRGILRQTWEEYNEQGLSLTTAYVITHAAFRMLADEDTELRYQKPLLDQSCPLKFKDGYEAFGVAGVLPLGMRIRVASCYAITPA